MSLYSIIRSKSLASKPLKCSSISNKSFNGSWMKEIFGFNDHDILENSKNKSLQTFMEHKAKYDINTGKLHTPRGEYDAGWFINPTLKDIRQTLSKLQLPPGKLNVIIKGGIDVGDAHINAAPYEVFQGASQFNALEMVNHNITPFHGIENYIYDDTQGPRTALSCAPGTFIRNYWMLYKNGSQFNALENLNISHTNGYLLWGDNPEQIEQKINIDTIENIMIPCMLYTQVAGITILSGTHKHVLPKRVHQIYSSAAPIDAYGNSGNMESQLNIVKCLIKAQYFGAIGMGIILHEFDMMKNLTNLIKPRINLTLIGTGVFNIPEPVTIDIITKVIEEFKDYDCDVIIHGYRQHTIRNIERVIV